jgi:hypothetical protein
MWPEKIETAYQAWVTRKELFHPIDFKYFAVFLWACNDNPSGAPTEAEFAQRLAQDRNLEPDEQQYPHAHVQKAQTLFGYFPLILENKPNK